MLLNLSVTYSVSDCDTLVVGKSAIIHPLQNHYDVQNNTAQIAL